MNDSKVKLLFEYDSKSYDMLVISRIAFFQTSNKVRMLSPQNGDGRGFGLVCVKHVSVCYAFLLQCLSKLQNEIYLPINKMIQKIRNDNVLMCSFSTPCWPVQICHYRPSVRK